MAFVLASTIAFATLHACIRYLSSEIHAFEIAFFRSFFGFLFLSPLFLRHGLDPLRTGRLGFHLMRGAVQASQTMLSFLALMLVPLAQVAALQFTSPLFAALLAVLFLGERMGPRRTAVMLFGFAGTMVIIRPDTGSVDAGALVALGGAVAWALTIILVKMLSRTESSVTITMYGALCTTPCALAGAIPFWVTPSWEQLAWLVVIGGLGTAAHLTFAQACRETEATAVLPLDFTKLIWAALLGYFAFGEVPAPWTWIGGAMIFSASLYLAYREKREADARSRTSPPAAGA